jgi:hypothetical protein
MLETLLLALAVLAPVDAPPPLWSPPMLKLASAPSYQPAARMVDNWRFESAFNLDLSPLSALGVSVGVDLPQTPRCIKLNNYWCIKRAGWNGEIAADADGHVAFASALEGAAVAALLLRRYYVEYGRHSARAIVTRWAPAQCSPFISVARLALPAPRPDLSRTALRHTRSTGPSARAAVAKMLPQRVVPMGLAPHGIEHTLRARWLASHGRGGAARKSMAARRAPHSRIASAGSLNDLLPAPTIAEGMGEPPRKPASLRLPAIAGKIAPVAGRIDRLVSIPVASCAGESERIANYAARVAEGVAAGPDDDLKLFSPDGFPTEKLPLVMANMAAVEIGPLRASTALISLAVDQLRSLLRPDGPHQ